MTMGEKIQLLRKKQNWSQEILAEKLSVSRQAVSLWERDGAVCQYHRGLETVQTPEILY